MATYLAYRCLLIDDKNSLFFLLNPKPKKEILQELFQKIENNKKIEFKKRGNKYFLFFYKRLSENQFLVQLAREESFSNPEESDTKIIINKGKRLAYIFVIADINTQVFLIQKKTSVFKDEESVIDKLTYFLEREVVRLLGFTSYEVKFREISKGETFWQEVETASKIYSLELVFQGTNLFGGRIPANDLIKSAEKETNFKELRMKFLNKLGDLHIVREQVQDFINQIASGGGKYIMNFVERLTGKKKVFDSKDSVETVALNDNPDEINQDELNKSINYLDKLNENNLSNPEKLDRIDNKKDSQQ